MNNLMNNIKNSIKFISLNYPKSKFKNRIDRMTSAKAEMFFLE